MNDKMQTAQEILRNISTQDLASFGMQQMAYIRPVILNGMEAFAICAADGTHLAFHQDENTAKVLTRQHALEPMTVH